MLSLCVVKTVLCAAAAAVAAATDISTHGNIIQIEFRVQPEKPIIALSYKCNGYYAIAPSDVPIGSEMLCSIVIAVWAPFQPQFIYS